MSEKLDLSYLTSKVFSFKKLTRTGVVQLVDENEESVMLAGLLDDIDPLAIAIQEIPNMIKILQCVKQHRVCSNCEQELSGENELEMDRILDRLDVAIQTRGDASHSMNSDSVSQDNHCAFQMSTGHSVLFDCRRITAEEVKKLWKENYFNCAQRMTFGEDVKMAIFANVKDEEFENLDIEPVLYVSTGIHRVSGGVIYSGPHQIPAILE